MEVDSENTVLISADYLGFIYVWNIDGYCLDGAEVHSPECACLFYIVIQIITVGMYYRKLVWFSVHSRHIPHWQTVHVPIYYKTSPLYGHYCSS